MLMIVLRHLPEIVFLSPDQTTVESGDNGTILYFEWRYAIMMDKKGKYQMEEHLKRGWVLTPLHAAFALSGRTT